MERFWNLVHKVVEACLKLVFRILKKELKPSTTEAITQFVKFGIVGVSNTLFDYAVYLVTLLALQALGWFPNVDYVIANVMGFLLSVLWSFYWNNKYVFREKKKGERSIWKTLFKTYCTYAFSGLVVKNVLSYVFIQLLQISKVVAPLLTIVVTVPLNFVMNKFWAFKEK